MAWDPAINVVDPNHFRDNIIAHFEEVQADALAWANGGDSLPVIRDFHKSPRMVTVFPAITFLQIATKTKWEEILETDFAITIECAIIHGNRDILSERGTKYAMAVESMLVNIPETTFNADSIIDITSTGMSVETAFAVQDKYKNQFIEVFQTRASWHIEASAFQN